MMDESTYHALAEETLHTLAEALEAADEVGNLDVELSDGILTVTLESGKQFVINRHTASRQIWVSSPISGASHHRYISDEQSWRDSEGRELIQLLEDDFVKAAGVKINVRA